MSQPKCEVCNRRVVKFEELLACGKTWHKACCKCGGTSGLGCKKALLADTLHDHEGQPFCSECYIKLFGRYEDAPKTTTDYSYPKSGGLRPVLKPVVVAAPVADEGRASIAEFVDSPRSYRYDIPTGSTGSPKSVSELTFQGGKYYPPVQPAKRDPKFVPPPSYVEQYGMEARPITTAILDEINGVRTNPASYAQYVQEHLDTFIDDFVYRDPIYGRKIRTRGGVDDVRACIDDLNAQIPVPPLQPFYELEQAALCHANDCSQNDIVGLTGSDGSSFKDRISRYGAWRGKIGENSRYGNSTVRSIVVQWLIDDGRPQRDHRNNLLNPNFEYVGAAIAGHNIHGVVAIATFAQAFD